MNQLNRLYGDEPTDPPIYCNILPLAVQLKSRTSPPNKSPVFFAIMGILNHHVVDNGDIEVYSSEYPILIYLRLYSISGYHSNQIN